MRRCVDCFLDCHRHVGRDLGILRTISHYLPAFCFTLSPCSFQCLVGVLHGFLGFAFVKAVHILSL